MQETVTREDRRSRRQIGGVGGIMARELGRAGADVTLLAPVITSQKREMATLLEEHGVKPMLVERFPQHTRRAEADIQVKAGEPFSTKGYFAKPPSMADEIRNCRESFEYALAALYIEPDDLSLLARLGGNLVANATTKGMAPRLARMRGITAATMNHQEHAAAARQLHFGIDENPAVRLGISRVFVTRGPKGRTDYWMNGNERHLPAIKAPQGADFIGAGDSLTAGYAYAIANALATDETMDQFLADLLRYNADSYQ